MKKTIALLLAVLMFCSAFAALSESVHAEDDTAPMFTDIENHWGRPYIERAVKLGFFNGVTADRFEPNSPMNREMFVTVLGRYAGVNPEEWNCSYLKYLFNDINPNSYYAPYLAWAVHTGVVNGTGPQKFSPKTNITRQEIATMLYRFLTINHCTLSDPQPVEPPDPELPPVPIDAAAPGLRSTDSVLEDFIDYEKVSGYAWESMEYMVANGIIYGKSTEAGQILDPKAKATRAEAATLVCRLYDRTVWPEEGEKPYEPESVSIVTWYGEGPLTEWTLEFRESVYLSARIEPDYGSMTNEHVIWYSTDTRVATVDSCGYIQAVNPGVTQITAVACNRKSATITLTVKEPLYPLPPSNCTNYYMTNEEKWQFLFGDSDGFSSPEEAEAHMVGVRIRYWDFKSGSSGEKVTKYKWVQVHEKLESTVKGIFEDIYNLPEKPVIHSVGGFRKGTGTSEHDIGAAIDVNPNENYCIDSDGTIVSGKYFKPGEDPYSMPLDGSVELVFRRYGFSRGLWAHRKDYMHYSLFGT